MTRERVILHVDMNSFYASVELLYQPELRPYPVAVGGDVEQRHGIILAKNQKAKKMGVKTGEALWEARQKCPGLVVVPPNYALYLRYSQKARQIYRDYTPYIEPFGLDEAWLDVTGADGRRIAAELHRRIGEELGLTVSVGVSWNKIYAKLGSDMRKPAATTVIERPGYREKVYPLPVEELLYVGPATKRKLHRLGVRTIGELAALPVSYLADTFGKVGVMLSRFARGEDDSQVLAEDDPGLVKSVGNSLTTPRDLVSNQDVKLLIYALSESVAARLREQHLAAQGVSLSVRDSGLGSFSVQMKLPQPSDLTLEIAEAGVSLFRRSYSWQAPIRSLGVRAIDLVPDKPYQMAFFPEEQERELRGHVDQTLDQLRERFGYETIRRGLLLVDPMGELDAKTDHVIAPVSFLKTGDRVG